MKASQKIVSSHHRGVHVKKLSLLLALATAASACDLSRHPRKAQGGGDVTKDGYQLMQVENLAELKTIVRLESDYEGQDLKADRGVSGSAVTNDAVSGAGVVILQYVAKQTGGADFIPGTAAQGRGVLKLSDVKVCGQSVSSCGGKVECLEAGLFNPNVARGSIAFKPTAAMLDSSCAEPLSFKLADARSAPKENKGETLTKIKTDKIASSSGAPAPVTVYRLSYELNQQTSICGVAVIPGTKINGTPSFSGVIPDCHESYFGYDQTGTKTTFKVQENQIQTTVYETLVAANQAKSLTETDLTQARIDAKSHTAKYVNERFLYDSNGASTDDGCTGSLKKDTVTINPETGQENITEATGATACLVDRTVKSFVASSAGVGQTHETCQVQDLLIRKRFAGGEPLGTDDQSPITACTESLGQSFLQSTVTVEAGNDGQCGYLLNKTVSYTLDQDGTKMTTDQNSAVIDSCAVTFQNPEGDAYYQSSGSGSCADRHTAVTITKTRPDIPNTSSGSPLAVSATAASGRAKTCSQSTSSLSFVSETAAAPGDCSTENLTKIETYEAGVLSGSAVYKNAQGSTVTPKTSCVKTIGYEYTTRDIPSSEAFYDPLTQTGPINCNTRLVETTATITDGVANIPQDPALNDICTVHFKTSAFSYNNRYVVEENDTTCDSPTNKNQPGHTVDVSAPTTGIGSAAAQVNFPTLYDTCKNVIRPPSLTGGSITYQPGNAGLYPPTLDVAVSVSDFDSTQTRDGLKLFESYSVFVPGQPTLAYFMENQILLYKADDPSSCNDSSYVGTAYVRAIDPNYGGGQLLRFDGQAFGDAAAYYENMFGKFRFKIRSGVDINNAYTDADGNQKYGFMVDSPCSNGYYDKQLTSCGQITNQMVCEGAASNLGRACQWESSPFGPPICKEPPGSGTCQATAPGALGVCSGLQDESSCQQYSFMCHWVSGGPLSGGPGGGMPYPF